MCVYLCNFWHSLETDLFNRLEYVVDTWSHYSMTSTATSCIGKWIFNIFLRSICDALRCLSLMKQWPFLFWQLSVKPSLIVKLNCADPRNTVASHRMELSILFYRLSACCIHNSMLVKRCWVRVNALLFKENWKRAATDFIETDIHCDFLLTSWRTRPSSPQCLDESNPISQHQIQSATHEKKMAANFYESNGIWKRHFAGWRSQSKQKTELDKLFVDLTSVIRSRWHCGAIVNPLILMPTLKVLAAATTTDQYPSI
jgi:hypothetical protein